MAVQAQYPSSILLSDLRKRLSSEMYGVDGGDMNHGLDSSSQGHHHHHRHLLHSFYGASTGTSASNLHQTTPANISCNVAGALDNVPNIMMTRKKLRSSENSIIESTLPPAVHNSNNNTTTCSSMQNPSLIISNSNNIPSHHHEVLTNSADLMNNCRNFLNVQTTTASPAICFNSSNSNNNMLNIAPRFNANGFGNLLSRPQQLTAAVSSVTNGNDNFTIPDKSSSIAFNNCSSSYSSGFQLQYILRQKEDIDQIIHLHGEQMKKALERKIQNHSRSLLALMQKCMESSMREKEIEIEEAKHRNQELEERVKQISLESHLWQNAARHNEAMVNSLRSNLEQILAQSREQEINNLGNHGNDNYNMKEGCGETDGDQIDADEHIDAESCVYGETIKGRKDCHGDEDHHNVGNLFLNESIMEGKHPCRFCKKNEVCILLLPCRHLCLCKECDTRFAHNCPICGCTKDASMRVFME